MSLFRNFHLPAWLCAGVFFLFAGCGESDSGPSVTVQLKAETVNCNVTTNSIIALGDAMSYVATILGQEIGDAWCSFSSFDALVEPEFSKTGFVGTPMKFYIRPNETDEVREVLIRIVFDDGFDTTLAMRQNAFSESPDFDRQWGEQPAFRKNDAYIYKTYYTTLTRGGYVRNYSICFDTEKRVSHWVAYPLTINYVTPNLGRPNPEPWAYDPNTYSPAIPQSAQAYIVQGYGSGAVRGHQLPSADRYSTKETNAMTYYAVNIMPQNYDFNGGIWLKLEEKVRYNMTRTPSDTIFVVTGTYFGTSKTLTDRTGKTVAIPSNCWKVLLRGSNSKAVWECSASELYAIGFWFANDASNTGTLRSYATSVDDIEQKTGFSFFRNLPADAAAAVKAQNKPADWGL